MIEKCISNVQYIVYVCMYVYSIVFGAMVFSQTNAIQ